MASAHSVQNISCPRKSFRRLGTARRASINVVLSRDVFGLFVDEVIRMRPRRVEIVSPWLGDGQDMRRVGTLLRHLERYSTPIAITTRTPDSDRHREVAAAFAAYPEARIVANDRLHAKLYVCEDAYGRGLAVVGSANLSQSSKHLDESAVLIRPLAKSCVIRDMLLLAVALGGGGWERRLVGLNTGRSTPE